MTTSVTYQIKTGGELTTITKMARKAPKCRVGMNGVPPPHRNAATIYEEFAWNYNQQRPIRRLDRPTRGSIHEQQPSQDRSGPPRSGPWKRKMPHPRSIHRQPVSPGYVPRAPWEGGIPPEHIPHQHVANYSITYNDFLLLRPGEWLNDTILNNIGRLLCTKSPHRQVRKWWASNNVTRLRRNPRDPEIAAGLRLRRATRTDIDDRPTINDPLILTAWNYGLHWTLLIRERDPDGTIRFYLMDSLLADDVATINDIRNALRHSVLVPPDWDEHIHIIPGFSQTDGHNCGVFVLLHAYFWIFHPDGLHPKDINWHLFENSIPDLITKFRAHLAAILVTGTVINYFQGTRMHLINNPNPPIDPTRTDQTSIADFFTPPDADDDSDDDQTPTQPRKRSSRRGQNRGHKRREGRNNRKRKPPSDSLPTQASEPPK